MDKKEQKGYLWFILSCCILVGLVSVIFYFLSQKIQSSQEAFYTSKLDNLLSRNELSGDGKQIEELAHQFTNKIWLDKKISLATSQVYQLSSMGYGGKMTFLVLVIDERIRDFELIESKETPGIGDLFSNLEWLSQFTSVSSGKFSYDAVVGSTITSKAIAEALEQLYQYLGVL